MIVTEADERPGEDGKTITIAPGLFSRSREGSPSDLKRRLSGDLDGILLKALEKDPRRRYRSVDQMSADLDRHLGGQPVTASQSSRLADLARAVSRYRLSVVLALALLIALLTGAVRVDWRGITLVAGAAGFLALWHVATDREFGSRVSEYIYGMEAPFIIAAGIATVVLARVALFFLPAWSGEQLARMILLVLCLALLLYLASVLGLWTVRARWAGSLVCSIRTADRQIWPAFTIMWLAQIVGDLVRTRHRSNLDLVDAAVYLALMLVSIVYAVVISPVLEVRDRGLLLRGRLISWIDIERYEWENTAYPQDLIVLSMREKREALRLHVNRLFPFLPSPRVRVPADKQLELDSNLKHHLSEWPE
jgi:hypothetical protein